MKSLKFYYNAGILKAMIYEENKNKLGIYRWHNLINNKSYIGSSKNLTDRFNGYYSTRHLIQAFLKIKV